MKEIVVGPHVAASFPTREWKNHGFRSQKSEPSPSTRYLDMMEDCLLVGVGEAHPYTMVGPGRLRNIRRVLNEVTWTDVQGHFIETGVWRGGASIYARACLAAWAQYRIVYAADSFAGLPPPDPKYPADAYDHHFENKALVVPLEEVQENFKRFGFENDEQTVFVKGWFDESLPALLAADPGLRFCVIRLDGDMYGSTMDALVNLYDRLSPGGFCIIDDFSAVLGCQKAVNQFRANRGIEAQMWNIDGVGIFWQKERE